MTRRNVARVAVAVAASMISASGAMAQGGPVASACGDEIAKYCADKEHGRGEVRQCLEANKDKVSAGCKTALETSGSGRGMGMGHGMGGGGAPR